MPKIEVAVIKCPGCGEERPLTVGYLKCKAKCKNCEVTYRFIESEDQCGTCENPDRLDCLVLPTVFIGNAKRSSWTFEGKVKRLPPDSNDSIG